LIPDFSKLLRPKEMEINQSARYGKRRNAGAAEALHRSSRQHAARIRMLQQGCEVHGTHRCLHCTRNSISQIAPKPHDFLPCMGWSAPDFAGAGIITNFDAGKRKDKIKGEPRLSQH
jgi:hypothetical protein